MDEVQPDEVPNRGMLPLTNQPPGAPAEFPANEVVDPGFLELVRYGIRDPHDPLIVDSVRVIDAVLKVETPFGPCWRRYNHDGYGQRPDGGPFQGWGQGRAWPLLTAERGHYELAAGHPVGSLVRALEGFAHGIGLLPEQIWDEADRPDRYLFLGRPTGGARPLMWGPAEDIKILRSIHDGQVFDFIPQGADRYPHPEAAPLEILEFKPQPRVGPPESTLRILAPAPLRPHRTPAEWRTQEDTPSSPTALGMEFADVAVPGAQQAPLRFTFFWPAAGHWEGHDYQVGIE